jgi:hypothetical protein
MNTCASEFCNVDEYSIRYLFTLSDFIKTYQYVEEMEACVAASRKDEEIKSNIENQARRRR